MFEGLAGTLRIKDEWMKSWHKQTRLVHSKEVQERTKQSKKSIYSIVGILIHLALPFILGESGQK